MTFPGATLADQSSKYEDVFWQVETRMFPPPLVPRSFPDVWTGQVHTLPTVTKNAMDPNDPDPPFWIFDYEVNPNVGLRLTDICVANLPQAGAAEDVIQEIAFDDLFIEFEGEDQIPFDLMAAFQDGESALFVGQAGVECHTNDDLYQRGIMLRLINKVCDVKVTLELSVVFRGAKNDFDPGGVPVAMLIWPQISWRWEMLPGQPAANRVERFRGSVKTTVCNYMTHAHGNDGPPPQANIASFFSDSNWLPTEANRPPGAVLQQLVGAASFAPVGWAKLFDYVKLNVQQETEFVAAYGPRDGEKYRKVSEDRHQHYEWPVGATTGIDVFKFGGQGSYDNVHVHGKMEPLSSTTVQIHAPFCGHSCVHMHWRWGPISAMDVSPIDAAAAFFLGGLPAFEFRKKYLGWSRDENPISNRWPGMTLTPPNQRVTIALCRENATRFSDAHIIEPNQGVQLDGLRKMIYYQVDIFQPDAGASQVIWPHGMGWAFRYTLPTESTTIRMLAAGFARADIATGSPNQHEIADFFVDDVYPAMRYIYGNPAQGDQVPDGSHAVAAPSTSATTSMEDL